jgi:uncharacterized protein YggU (UPF0235/DUF167 family)
VEWEGADLHVWVRARAADGAANRAVARAVARAFGVRPSAVTLVTGERGREKVVEVVGQEGRGTPRPYRNTLNAK